MHAVAAADALTAPLPTRPQHDAAAMECSPALRPSLEAAVAAVNAPLVAVPLLVSGAGHDGLAMADLCPVSMLFVRCRGGVSHSPAEFVAPEDVQAAVGALLHLLRATA
jgi:allantoate deiminase